MNLAHCRNLIKTPDFTETPNLEELVLDGCKALKQVHPSVGTLSNLITLNLKRCINLENPPNSTELKSLRILNLSGCKKLDKFPQHLDKMKDLIELHADGTLIDQLPSSVSFLWNLQVLKLGQREDINTKSLGSILWPSLLRNKMHNPPSTPIPSLSGLKLLKELDVSHCQLTDASVSGVEGLSMLKILNLSGNDFERLPNLGKLLKLDWIGLVGCKKMEALPELPPNIQVIEAQDCTSLKELPSKLTMYENDIQSFGFTNCDKLIENLSIESLVARLLPQGRIDPYKKIGVYLPGSDVPGWFTHQTMGDCITMELPPNWSYENFKGIAFCLVFTPKIRNRRKSRYNSIGYRFRNFDGTPIGFDSYTPDCVFQYESIGIKSDQMWLSYGQSYPDWKKAKNFITVTFEIFGDCVVKKCGARLVCREDEREEEGSSGSRMIQWLPPSSSVEDDDLLVH